MPEIAGQVADGFADAVREHEERWLSPLAVRSYETRGRELPEEPCRLRTPFQRDRDRIVHSKAFRRLRHKTQVFVDPEGDHFRTRLTHTLEASGIARGVARALRLNEDLTEAVAVGHDLGHPPFGHAGEQALDELLRERGGSGFRHNEHSLRVVERLERDGRGLNLTWEVRDGILKHTGPDEPETLEGRIVRIVDRFAYINHDIDDALRAGLLEPADLPAEPIELLGDSGPRRIDTLVHDLVETSARAGDILQSDEIADGMLALRAFMFERIYLEQDHGPARAAVRRIFEQLVDRQGTDVEEATDYLAGMTDRFALSYAAALD
jgi:dGTPase